MTTNIMTTQIESQEFVEVPPVEENPSIYTSDYTYSYDKYSCVRQFYFLHIAFNYVIFLSGIFAMVTRVLPPRLKIYHAWCGRVYILSMLWSTCTSLLMNNTGLPTATLISFATTMVGLTFGWIIIVIYKARVEASARTVVENRLMVRLASRGKVADIADDDHNKVDLHAMTDIARSEILDARTWAQRFFSLKALHGILFFASWFQIAGRIFATKLTGDYKCETYPVYKPIESRENVNGTMSFVPFEDPHFHEKPWANGMAVWFLQTTVGAIAIAVIVGLVVSVWSARKAENRIAGEDISSDTDHITEHRSEEFKDEEDA